MRRAPVLRTPPRLTRPRPLTSREFGEYLQSIGLGDLLEKCDVLGCLCGDFNCKGWRLVEREPAA